VLTSKQKRDMLGRPLEDPTVFVPVLGLKSKLVS
jgi:hypothetical protein